MHQAGFYKRGRLTAARPPDIIDGTAAGGGTTCESGVTGSERPRHMSRQRTLTIRQHLPAKRHDEMPVVIEARALPPVQSEPGGYVGRKPGQDRMHRVPRRRLVTARKNAGMTQFELAVATGLTNTAISNLENGVTRYPRLVTMERLSAALGVPLKWLCEE